MITFKNILQEGIFTDQSKIDLFIDRVNQAIKLLCDGSNENFNKNFFEEHQGFDYLLLQISQYMDDITKDVFASFKSSIWFDFKLSVVEKEFCDVRFWATGASTSKSDLGHNYWITIKMNLLVPESILNMKGNPVNYKREALKNWWQFTEPYFNTCIRHELIHVMQGEKDKTHKFSVKDIEGYKARNASYWYDQHEIGAYANQYALEMWNKKIPLEDITNQKFLKGFFNRMMGNQSDLPTKYYIEENTPQSRKFWKYVYLYYQKYLNQ